MKEFQKGETTGAIQALKWVLFIMTYKHISDVKEEINKFISQLEKEGDEFKNLERY